MELPLERKEVIYQEDSVKLYGFKGLLGKSKVVILDEPHAS